MSIASPPAELRRLELSWQERHGVRAWLGTVDHKRLGIRYLWTAAVFFALGGASAALIRAQLATPNGRLLGPEAYDQVFTMHGVTMIFLFATPMLSGFGNYLVPLMIGARDMAFPRLNAFGYWVFLASGVLLWTSVALGSAPNAGWFNYVPLSGSRFDPGSNIDYYGWGLIFLGISTTAGAINFIVTLARLRAPGMSLDRMPLFCWSVLATSLSVVFAVPMLTAANLLLELDRQWGLAFYDTARGGSVLLWQELFWLFGHPDVYIIFLPAVGIVSSIVPAFARRPMVAQTWVAMATMTTAVIGFGVWVHHMFAADLPAASLIFFAAASLLIAVPSGIQVFAWIATLRQGTPYVRAPLLFVLGFVVTFTIGGLTGVMFAVIPFDQQATDSYFVVAHFHYVLFGGAVFPILAGLHYWLPKMSGRLYEERVASAGFWLIFAGFNATFFPMHIAGLLGMPRRVWTYPDGLGWNALNLIESLGAAVLAVGLVLTAVNLVVAARRGPAAAASPWGGETLEWTTTSPPPVYNFAVIPTVRSGVPAWDEPDGEGALVLAEGHATAGTSELEGSLTETLAMPDTTLWPLALGAALLVLFAGLVGKSAPVAIAGGALAALALGGWHWRRPAAAPVEPAVDGTARLARSTAWWGTAGFVASEAALFAALLAAYWYLRVETAGPWPPRGVPAPAFGEPLLATAMLVAAAAAVVVATRQRDRARAALAVAFVLGAGFLVLSGDALRSALDQARPASSAYASSFETVTALHLAHVAAGLVLLAWTALRVRHDRPAESLVVARLVWLFLAVLGVALFLILDLSPRW